MRLHKFREFVDANKLLSLPDDFPRELDKFESFIQFDFGDVTSIPDNEWMGLQDYAMELIDADMFRMPFEWCFYTYKADGLDFSAAIVERDRRLFCFAAIGEPGVPCAFVANIMIWLERHVPEKFKLASEVFFSPDFRAYYYDQHRQKAIADESSTIASRNILALTMLLSAKGVEQIITPAPHKLNKHRAQSGKPLIGEVREIVIRHGKKTYLSSGQERGSHASPRMHWRRGHLRRLPNGEVTNVRPCLVGSIGDARLPEYSVRAA